MIFNYKDIKISQLDAIKIKKSSDSLDISISYKTVNTTTLNNISISVLPQNTITYNQQQNIVSQTYLQPYIKGAVDNAPFYFKNTNNATKYHLDNLLLTQGWSSYSWNAIFNHSPNLNYFFEKGITLKETTTSLGTQEFAGVPVTVYDKLVPGVVKLTLGPVVVLSPVGGDQAHI